MSGLFWSMVQSWMHGRNIACRYTDACYCVTTSNIYIATCWHNKYLSGMLNRKVVIKKDNISFLYCPDLVEQMMKVITTVNMMAKVMTAGSSCDSTFQVTVPCTDQCCTSIKGGIEGWMAWRWTDHSCVLLHFLILRSPGSLVLVLLVNN